MITFATLADLDEIASCHQSAFPSSLATALGRDYVKKMLGWYLSSTDTFLFYLHENGKCLGYCGGMIKRQSGVGSASGMAQFSFNAAARALIKRPWLFFHRELRAKFPFIVKNIRRRIFGAKLSAPLKVTLAEPYAGLVVIGVDRTVLGKGYGSKLLVEFERITREKGFRKMMLSVRSDNVRAIASYLRNGWLVTEVVGDSTTMEKKID